MSETPENKILVIDDDRSIRINMVYFLEDCGFLAQAAENGRVGLEMFWASQYDLVIVDLRMPGLNGLEVLSEINAKSPATPIILISGAGDISDVIEALHRGAWDYILKPIQEMTVLKHAVETALDRARLLQENRRYQEHLEEEVAKRTRAIHIVNKELKRENAIRSQKEKALTTLNTRLRGIVESSKSFATCTRLDQAAPLFLEEFAKIMSASGGSLYIKQGNRLNLLHSLDPGHAPASMALPLDTTTIFGHALAETKPILINDIALNPALLSSGWQGYHNGSLLVFPLFDQRDELIGIVSLHNGASPFFTEQDRELGAIYASYNCETLRATQAIELLHTREEHYRLIAENTRDVIWTLNRDMRYTFISPSVKKLRGYTPEELIGRHVSDFFHPIPHAAPLPPSMRNSPDRPLLPNPKIVPSCWSLRPAARTTPLCGLKCRQPCFETGIATSSGSLASPGTSPNAGTWRPTSAMPRKWNPLAHLQEASPMISTTFYPGSWATRKSPSSTCRKTPAAEKTCITFFPPFTGPKTLSRKSSLSAASASWSANPWNSG